MHALLLSAEFEKKKQNTFLKKKKKSITIRVKQFGSRSGLTFC